MRGMLVHHRAPSFLLGSPNSSQVSIYTHGKRHTKWSNLFCVRKQHCLTQTIRTSNRNTNAQTISTTHFLLLCTSRSGLRHDGRSYLRHWRLVPCEQRFLHFFLVALCAGRGIRNHCTKPSDSFNIRMYPSFNWHAQESKREDDGALDIAPYAR